MLSILITSYNVERYIARAVASARAQTGVRCEIVVVDDASTDGTWEIVQSLRGDDMQCLRLTANRGPGAARNAGLALARGEWIAVLDGDDVFLPGRLARCLARVGEADLVVDDLQTVHEVDGTTAPMLGARLKTPLTLASFIEGNSQFLDGYTLGYLKPILRRSFLESHAIRYPEDIRIGEDYILMLRLLAAGARVAVEPLAGYGYTIRAGSISHRLSAADVARMEAADAAFFAQHRASPEALRAQARRLRNLNFALSYQHWVEALKARDINGLLRLITESPEGALGLWRPLAARLGWR